MNTFSLKNYPARILIVFICLIIAINYGLQELIKWAFEKRLFTPFEQLGVIVAASGTVVMVLRVLNKYAMWKWLLKLLGVADIRGTYEGTVVSSFHQEDDADKPNVELYSKVTITQNLNGFHIKGAFFTDQKMSRLSSTFKSFSEEMTKLPDGTWQVHYFYANAGDQLHADHRTYGLNNHEGVCVLTYGPEPKTLFGYYFNRERSSQGKIKLKYTGEGERDGGW